MQRGRETCKHIPISDKHIRKVTFGWLQTFQCPTERPKTHSIRVPTQQDWEKAAARRYAHLVLSNTSLLPFRWRGNRYICFYCYQTFHEASSLRSHTRSSHGAVSIMKHLAQNRSGNFTPIKVDVGEPIVCTKCKHVETTFEAMISHLKGHKLIADMEQQCFLPFQLADDRMSCLQCGESYRFFGMLYSHVNKAHLEGTRRICETCGQHFFSDFSLRKHMQVYHLAAEFKCRRCDAVFGLDTARIGHEFKEHNVKSFKCYKCEEAFGSQYLRQLHMNNVHLKEYFACSECSKTFIRRSLLARHVSRVHLKSFPCAVCGERFVDLPTLNVHAKKH